MTGTQAERPARVAPHSLEAEKALLGAVLLHGEVLTDVATILKPAAFFRDAHQRIFAHLLALHGHGQPIEFLTLNESLRGTDELEKVGGPAYIASLVDGMPRGTSVEAYADIVREKASLRAIIATATSMATAAYDKQEESHVVIDQAEQQLFNLAHGQTHGGFRPMQDIVRDAIATIEVWGATKTGVTGVPTGFADLDAITCGLQPGELILLASRPSMGKTSLVLNIAEHVALSGRTVGVFSLEMSETELAVRALTSHARVNSHVLRRGAARDAELQRLGAAVTALSDARLYIDQSSALTAFEIRSRARRLKVQHGLDLVIIDYLQLMTGHERQDNRTLELGAITRALKALAKDLRIPVVALSQLSRAPDTREDHQPRLSDLRESGSLEQDADVVLFLYRASQYEETATNRRTADLIIGKQRNGPLGTVTLGWIPEETRFVDSVSES